jgi:DNA topoisomerase I
MAKNLVIVESPAKVKTIKKFLGKNYEVVASNGHVRDLPKSQLGIDVENDFEPKYITIRGKGELLAALRKEVKKADKIYLATDPDREGEAISWHLIAALKLEGKDISRISFNEITKTAVRDSLKNAREIDMNLVDAQQARRVLDRIVGYQISPILWEKVKRGLSAGRVQSVALRIICDREDEINAFIPEEYWKLDAQFDVEGQKKPLIASLSGKNGEKIEIHNQEEMDQILAEMEGCKAEIKSIKQSQRSKNPPLPFTTSTLQQEASKQLNFSTQKTMRLAQQLYEGVAIKGRGTIAMITYLRTDSVRVSDEAQAMAEGFIREQYGEEYIGEVKAAKKENNNVQDAHEAIRPTDISLLPSDVKELLPRDLFRLYQLIWKRFTASRMSPAKYESKKVIIALGSYEFSVTASKIVFDGFTSVYNSEEEKEKKNVLLTNIDENTKLTLSELEPSQHFTQPPDHYTEASLVKTLEELGIGRPSTYAPTITTIIARRYIAKEKKNLFVTEIGEVVNKIMKESFPDIVDLNFTAKVEENLDEVENGSRQWKNILREFYPEFEEEVKTAEQELEKVEIQDEVTDTICENCGRNMVIKYGAFGKFLACPGFPECHNTKPYLEKAGVSCPKCGKEIVIRKTKKGRRFYGCEDYPDCDFTSWQKPSAKKCPQCGGYMLEKGKKLACADENCGYVEENENESND